MAVGSVGSSSGGTKSYDVGGSDGDNKDVKGSSDNAAARAAEEAARRAEEARREAEAQRQRDAFTAQSRPNNTALPSSAGNPLVQSGAPTFRVSATGALVTDAGGDAQAKAAINDLFKSELGRPCEDPGRILAEARAAGATTLEQVKAHVRKMIAGSPERAALEHINGQFQQLLGRGLGRTEQQAWLKGSGLSINSPTFQQDVSARIMASEEYRLQHPANAQSWLGKVPLIDQRKPDGAGAAGYNNANSNCGPTSAAMVARALGYGADKTDAELVMEMKNVGGTTAAGSDPYQVAKMVEHMGVGATVIDDPQGLSQLDAALDAGKMVIVNGDYYATGVEGRDGSQESGHFCVVTGKDASGNYIINDPWKGVQVPFSPEAMGNYFSEHHLKGALVIVEKPGTGAGPVASTPPSTPAPGTPGTDASLPPAGLRYDGGTTAHPEVKQLQEALVKAQLLSPEDMATGPGYYGKKTADAVARLQTEYGIPGDGRTFDAATRDALEKKLAGVAPQAPTTPQQPGTPVGGALPPFALNPPGNNTQDRYYYANWVKDNVMPRLQQLGVDPQLVKDAVWFGLSEGIYTVQRNTEYGQENGTRQSPLTFSNLGDDKSINSQTATPDGFGDYRFKSGNWQVGIAGAQVHDAIVPGNANASLVRAFKMLYPDATPQQVGQRMLDMMGETDGQRFPNLSIEDLVKLDKNGQPVNAKWASILMRDPYINVLIQTWNPAIKGPFNYGKDIADSVFS